MEQKKLPNLLSTDDLLSSLEQDNNETESVVDDYDKAVTEFVLRYNLKPGNDFISNGILHPLFKAGSKEEISHKLLNRYIAIHLPKEKNGFLIDLATSKITKNVTRKLSKKTKDKFRSFDFQEFMDFYGIKQGKKKIESDTLYLLYEDWTNKNTKSKLNKEKYLAFFRQKLKLFVTKDNKKYFKLTKTLEEIAGRGLSLEIERQAQSEDQDKENKQQESTINGTEEKKEQTALKESKN